MTRKRITEAHPHYKLIQKAIDALEEFGVSFSVMNHQIYTTVENQEYEVLEVEDDRGCESFPPVFEVKYVFGQENDDLDA